MGLVAKDVVGNVMNGVIWELELVEIEDNKAVTESVIEGQKTQWPKNKEQMYKQRSTKHYTDN